MNLRALFSFFFIFYFAGEVKKQPLSQANQRK